MKFLIQIINIIILIIIQWGQFELDHILDIDNIMHISAYIHNNNVLYNDGTNGRIFSKHINDIDDKKIIFRVKLVMK